MTTLFLVATPIGNLDDFSPRGIEVLRSVSHIACEDTRTSRKLLDHFDIGTDTFSFHQHNEHRKVNRLIDLLDAGRDVALISDAGMPGISDPGFLASRAAHKAGHSVSVIPGPDAATTALAASGLPCDKYSYEGFLPHKKGRQKRIKQLAEEDRTLILYESPHRLMKLLEEINKQMGDRRFIAVARELTKKYEEVVRGRLAHVYREFALRDDIKGEITVIIAPEGYED